MPRALHFLHPWALAALPLMWALALWLAHRRARTGAWPRLVDADLLALLRLEGGGARARSPWPLIGALWTLGVVALAGPSWQRQVTAAYRLPAAWVLAVQLSPSMEASDLSPSRAAQARFAVDNLLAAAHDARVGLVAFAGEAYTVAPLTADGATVRNLDRVLSPRLMPEHGARLAPALRTASRLLHAWAGNDRQVIVLMDSVHDPARDLQAPLTTDLGTVHRFLDEAMVGIAGPQTAIGDAIGLAIKTLRQDDRGVHTHRQPLLILLTDGGNNTGVMPPLEAARLAAQTGLRIDTIGVGAAVHQSFFGVTGNTDLDQKLLQKIARITGGRYFRATDQGALRAVYRQIDRLEPVAGDRRWLRPSSEWFGIPLALALLLSIPAAWRMTERT